MSAAPPTAKHTGFELTTDANLTLEGLYPGQGGGVKDHVEGRPANPANTFTFSVDAAEFLAAGGQSWDAGEEVTLSQPCSVRSRYPAASR